MGGVNDVDQQTNIYVYLQKVITEQVYAKRQERRQEGGQGVG